MLQILIGLSDRYFGPGSHLSGPGPESHLSGPGPESHLSGPGPKSHLSGPGPESHLSGPGPKYVSSVNEFALISLSTCFLLVPTRVCI